MVHLPSLSEADLCPIRDYPGRAGSPEHCHRRRARCRILCGLAERGTHPSLEARRSSPLRACRPRWASGLIDFRRVDRRMQNQSISILVAAARP